MMNNLIEPIHTYKFPLSESKILFENNLEI